MAPRSSSDLGMGSNDSYHSGSPDSDSALGLKMLDFGSLNELTNQNGGNGDLSDFKWGHMLNIELFY